MKGWDHAATSSPVRTVTTSGIASAAVASRELTSAWASGECSTAAWAVPGRSPMLSAKRPRPVSSAASWTSSPRRTRCTAGSRRPSCRSSVACAGSRPQRPPLCVCQCRCQANRMRKRPHFGLAPLLIRRRVPLTTPAPHLRHIQQGHFTLRFQAGIDSPDDEIRTRSGRLAASAEPTDRRDGTDESAPAHPEDARLA